MVPDRHEQSPTIETCYYTIIILYSFHDSLGSLGATDGDHLDGGDGVVVASWDLLSKQKKSIVRNWSSNLTSIPNEHDNNLPC